MNRYLLAGCAAVALAMGCGAANAQAKFEVRIGGDAYFEAGFIDQDNDRNVRDTEFRNRFRLNIVPSAKADNGLEYGGRIRIRANNADRTTDADRSLIFVAGSFGRVELGTRNSFNDDLYYSRPQDYEFLGIYDSPVLWAGTNTQGGNTPAALLRLSQMSFGYLPTSTTTAINNADGGDVHSRIVYVSPRFSGLQLGAAYSPQANSSATNVNRAENDGSLQDVWEIGANYKGEFSGVTVGASVGYVGGSYENSGVNSFEDLTGVQAGLQVGYAGFVLGGGYIWYGESGQLKTARFKDDLEVWNVGIQYTTGPIVVGFGFTQGSDPGSINLTGDRTQDYYSLGASYTVAPGLRVQAEYAYIQLETNDSGTVSSVREQDSNVFILRSILTF